MSVFARRSKSVAFGDVSSTDMKRARKTKRTKTSKFKEMDSTDDKAGFCGGLYLLFMKKSTVPSRKTISTKNEMVERDTTNGKLIYSDSTATTDGASSHDGEAPCFPSPKQSLLVPPENTFKKKCSNWGSPRSVVSSLSFVTCNELDSMEHDYGDITSLDVIRETKSLEVIREVQPVEVVRETKSLDVTPKRCLQPCPCGHASHYLEFNPEFPLKTARDTFPGSNEDCLNVARGLCGYWVTLLDRSHPMDGHFKMLGLSMVKRAVMNRLAIPLSCYLEESNTIMRCLLHTPLGVRSMNCSLIGNVASDDDPDCGYWDCTAKVVDYVIPWYCDGVPVRALQQTRKNKRVGTLIDTRCVLPDKHEGKVMFYNITIIPHAPNSKRLSADRILKYQGPSKHESE